MSKRKREIPNRQRKPVIALVCEGRNKTERKYFNHFKDRYGLYNLFVYDSESTDILSMAKKCRQIFKNNQMDKNEGDRIFCLVDLDLSHTQYEKYLSVKKKYKEVNFIVSNPCFEIWLLYYFINNPEITSSSQKVKEQLKKIVPQYSESFDIVEKCNLSDMYSVAINRSQKKKGIMDLIKPLHEINPYTEIDDLVTYLMDYNKDEFNE